MELPSTPAPMPGWSGPASPPTSTSHPRAADGIREGLLDSLVTPRAVFESLEGHRFRTEVTSAEVLDVRRARRFTRPGAAVTLVDADWRLFVDFRF